MNEQKFIEHLQAQHKYEKIKSKILSKKNTEEEFLEILALTEEYPHLESDFINLMTDINETKSDNTINAIKSNISSIIINPDTKKPYKKDKDPKNRIYFPNVASENIKTDNEYDSWIYEEEEDFKFKIEIRYIKETNETLFIVGITKSDMDITANSKIILKNDKDNTIEILPKSNNSFRQKGIPGQSYIVHFQNQKHKISKKLKIKYIKAD